MPELPEVETIKRGLEKFVVGKTIKSVEFDWPKSFQGDKAKIIGSKITDINRRAKMIILKLSNGLNLAFHLKMTGQLIYRGKDLKHQFAGGHPDHEWHAQLPTKHTRIIFTFNDDSKLFFNDLRKFGWCKVLIPQGVEVLKNDYGLDPFDKNFDTQYLLAHAKRIPNRNIKQFLMDQAIAPGMGNIYTDETLFDAKITPIRKVKEIKMSEWQQLILSMRKILKLGIKHGGTTDSDYVDAEGRRGGMQDYLKVYHRTGKPCLTCKNNIKRIVIGGRGTHFCPKCQT